MNKMVLIYKYGCIIFYNKNSKASVKAKKFEKLLNNDCCSFLQQIYNISLT